MIKLENINKFFNKGRSNQIHVLKDINLEFPETGLVVIHGVSGSGKTTLLNILGGLDKPTSGKIIFKDHIFEKYHSKQWDRLRNEEVSVVFQNYNLLHELTVFDNIEMVLKMQGVNDQNEIKNKIDYITQKLGIFNYQNRKANALSGGQQQRVGIARALVKNPQVVIADEPTGNLDSKTTIEIMNIIKKISQTKLVLLVTHEDDIAEFYADRIIEINNGYVIKDINNKIVGNLDIKHDHIIYLKDLQKEKGNVGNVDIITYQDDVYEKLDRIGVEIIQRNLTLYLKISTNKYKNVKLLDRHSEIVLLDEHFTATKQIDDSSFEIPDYTSTQSHKNIKSAVSVKDSIKYSLRKIDNLTYGGKMLYLALGLVGALIAVSIGLIGQIFSIDDQDFISTNRNYINITNNHLEFEDVMAVSDLEYIKEVNLINELVEFSLETEAFYEVRNPLKFEAHPSSISLLDEGMIIYGVHPQDRYEVVIDRMIADQLIRFNTDRGVENYKDIINSSIKLQAVGLEGDFAPNTSIDFRIVGISNDDSPTIWMREELIITFALNTLADYHIFGDGFELISGTMPTEPYHLLLNEFSTLIRNGAVPSFVGIESGYYQVDGVYRYRVEDTIYDTRNIMVSTVDIMNYSYFYQNDFEYSGSSFLAYVDDVDIALQLLEENHINASSNYLDDLENYKEFEFVNSLGLFVFAIVGIIASGISIFFIMRSSLAARMYEVSVYRALGATKNDIRKMFIVEIAMISTISSLIGYTLMILLLIQTQNQVSTYVEILHYSVFSFITGMASLYFINIIFGLLPVNLVLYKTPANILTIFDV